MNDIKDAQDAKRKLANHLLMVKSYYAISSENGAFNKPDILGLTKSDMLIKYEIKLSKQDLMGELNSVKWCENAILLRNYNEPIQGEHQMEFDGKIIGASFRGNIFEPEGLHENIGKCSKLDKHKTYLIAKHSEPNGFDEYEQPYQPNCFYFAVTSDLVPLAEEVCKHLSYGVIDLNRLNNSTSIIKKAGFIHRDKASRHYIRIMTRSLSFAYWTK